MESAPKDGTAILAYSQEEDDDLTPQITVWLTTQNGSADGWYVQWDHTPLDGLRHGDVTWQIPTHWMPLPDPPAALALTAGET